MATNYFIATLIISTPPKPKLGTCNIFPSSGIACLDMFHFECTNWIGTNPKEALLYQFSFIDNNGIEIPLTPKDRRNPNFSCFLPSGNSVDHRLTVVTYIRDSRNQVTRFFNTITVLPPEFSNNNITNGLEAAVLSDNVEMLNNLLFCSAYNWYSFNYPNPQVITANIINSLNIRCSPIYFPQLVKSIELLSQCNEEQISSQIIQILETYGNCLFSSYRGSLQYSVNTLSNIMDTNLEHDQKKERLLSIIKQIPIYITARTVCGELFGNLNSKNIELGTTVNSPNILSSQVQSFNFHQDGNFIVPGDTFNNINSDCLIVDYSRLNRDLHQNDVK